MKIVFADDHYLILEGLKDLLEKTFKNSEVLLAINKKILFDILSEHKVDLLIQDIKFGEDFATEFLSDIRVRYPALKILIFSSISDASTIQKLSKKTQGYILKSEPTELICEGIKQVLAGEKYISPEATRITNQLFKYETDIHLTKRELDVVNEIMQEFPTKQIAINLQISEKTVEMHRTNIYSKLDVNNVTGLVKKVIGLGIIDG